MPEPLRLEPMDVEIDIRADGEKLRIRIVAPNADAAILTLDRGQMVMAAEAIGRILESNPDEHPTIGFTADGGDGRVVALTGDRQTWRALARGLTEAVAEAGAIAAQFVARPGHA